MRLVRQISKLVESNQVNARNYRGLSQKTLGFDGNRNNQRNKSKWALKVAACSAVTLAASYPFYKKLQAYSRAKTDPNNDHIDLSKAKVYSIQDVAEHNNLDKGIWITYKGKVYDITNFVAHHPGGSHTIMLGAGGDVEPFWKTYTVHDAAEVQRLLSTFQIGVLNQKDHVKIAKQNVPQLEGPYATDPSRSPLLHVHSSAPFNAETPSKLITNSYLTPDEIFFVRNHLPVPEVDLSDFRLSICFGSDRDPDNQKIVAEFTLEELKKKFQPHSIDCVIQCSGNRRSDLKRIKEIKGLDWKVGAMGNARWTGVRLFDVLESLGIKQNDSIHHIQLEGLDCDMTGQSYGASISADVAFNRSNEVLLAYEMNGKPLSRDHGFPLRFVCPGITGARNVKWLSKIILSDEESTSHWQRNDYKSFSPNIDMFNVDYKQSISIQEMPVQSAICDPPDGELLTLQRSKSAIPIRGYAYSGGGKMIVRVDVSIDGGKTWLTANLLDQPKNPDGTVDFTNRNHFWAWTRWSIEIPVPDSIVKENGGHLEIVCRAFDSAYNSQPERADTIWNVRGVVNNSWHKVKLKLKFD